MPIEKGDIVRLMSLSNDFFYPQFLVVFYLRNSHGFVSLEDINLFATRSAALLYIREHNEVLVASLRSDAFDSYTDALTPAFRLYHLTRAKI